MKILVTGSGGREHALIKKLLENKTVTKIYCAPGNGGTALEQGCVNVQLNSISEIADFAEKEGISLAVPGSEDMLVAGVADALQEKGVRVLGPHKAAALLEGSKCLAKEFMLKYGVKTAEYKNFTDYKEASDYLKSSAFPIVLKADGLAAGKGVLICQNEDEAQDALIALMKNKEFGEAGNKIVIEEFLEGVEASILSFYDGNTILPLISAKDHKKIGEGETGPNTGGMGVIAPNPHVDDQVMQAFEKEILKPTLSGLKSEGLQFQGVIFFGLMINSKGVYLLEYNLRMGDPETQAVLSLLDSDLLELIEATVDGKLKDQKLKWKKGSSCCVVMAATGYPGTYKKGIEIRNTENCGAQVFIAGANNSSGRILSSGGRVLNVVANGDDLRTAREECYSAIDKIDFPDSVHRRDIGGEKL